MDITIPLWLTLGLAGGLGQLLRILLGLKKAIDADQPIHLQRTFWSAVYGFVWGIVIGFFAPDWRIAFTTGLAATDLTESLIKVAQGSKKKEEAKLPT